MIQTTRTNLTTCYINLLQLKQFTKREVVRKVIVHSVSLTKFLPPIPNHPMISLFHKLTYFGTTLVRPLKHSGHLSKSMDLPTQICLNQPRSASQQFQQLLYLQHVACSRLQTRENICAHSYSLKNVILDKNKIRGSLKVDVSRLLNQIESSL